MTRIIKRTCLFCKKPFETENKQKVYCTKKCSAANHQNKIKNRVIEKNVTVFDWKDYNNSIF